MGGWVNKEKLFSLQGGVKDNFPVTSKEALNIFLVEQRDNTLRNITSNIRGAKLPSTDKEVSREQLIPEY